MDAYVHADQWDSQTIVQKIVAELQRRAYLVWFDLERMKGSVMDASECDRSLPHLLLHYCSILLTRLLAGCCANQSQ
jgi:hypothetical protein